MIEVIQGDLLKSDTDTIVNPANGHLVHSGGVARLIANAAASAEWRGEQEDHPLIPTGGAGWTSSGALKQYKGIVHAVGPIWGGGAYMEETLLYSAHAHALLVAAKHGCRSVAFPAISCGIFGYPVELAAPAALRAAHTQMTLRNGIDRIVFVLFEDDHYAAYQKAAGELVS